jgi:hypothetical protein
VTYLLALAVAALVVLAVLAATTHTFGFTAAGGSDSLPAQSVVSSGTLATEVDVTVPAATTDQAYPLAIDVSELESIYLYTDGDLTVQTNDGTTPQETLTFVSGKPLLWYNGMPGVAVGDVFAGDVTGLFLTNAGASAVRLRGLVNQSE